MGTEGQRQGHGDRDRYRKRMTVKWTGTPTWSDGHGQEVRDCDRQTGNGDTDRATYVLPTLVTVKLPGKSSCLKRCLHIFFTKFSSSKFDSGEVPALAKHMLLCGCSCPFHCHSFPVPVPVPVSLSLSFCPHPYTFVPLTLSLYPVPVCLSQSLPMSKVKVRITIQKKGEGSLVHLGSVC